ncbi:hypothetical protein FF38_01686, partial [Lucilia cuprina]
LSPTLFYYSSLLFRAQLFENYTKNNNNHNIDIDLHLNIVEYCMVEFVQTNKISVKLFGIYFKIQQKRAVNEWYTLEHFYTPAYREFYSSDYKEFFSPDYRDFYKAVYGELHSPDYRVYTCNIDKAHRCHTALALLFYKYFRYSLALFVKTHAQ